MCVLPAVGALGQNRARRELIRTTVLIMRRARVQVSSTALIWAAQGGHADVVTLLLDRGAAIEAKDKVRAACS
jgi:hypothetical protein